jgi:hypothetical protein
LATGRLSSEFFKLEADRAVGLVEEDNSLVAAGLPFPIDFRSIRIVFVLDEVMNFRLITAPVPDEARSDLFAGLTSGARQPTTNFNAEKIYRFDVSPDGRYYALARGDYFYDAVRIGR